MHCQICHRVGKILRICWETNGSVGRSFLKQMADVSLQSGGCIKFDLKAWDLPLHRALCGVSNRPTLANFEYLAGLMDRRPDPPLLIAATCLVPGYVDADALVSVVAMFFPSSVFGLDTTVETDASFGDRPTPSLLDAGQLGDPPFPSLSSSFALFDPSFA